MTQQSQETPPVSNRIEQEETGTFEQSLRRSAAIWEDLPRKPQRYTMLTGDRPTGMLHIGHLFGSLQNRVKLQNLGVNSFIVIADYQVLTDRETAENIPESVREIILDYLAAGLDPNSGRTFIFCHSQVPELNQLLLPFLSLVSMPELDRNPTVKEEISAAGLRVVQAIMYTYPVHQAADILFCKGNIVPVGKDQLPHLELTRKIARRFNDRFCKKAKPVFPIPEALLSEAPVILGLDGGQKMSKSRGNSILLMHTEDETRALIKKAKTDTDRNIFYDTENRPEVSNLLRIASLSTGRSVEDIAGEIGDGGSGKLKLVLTEALNSYLAPLRARRAELAKDPHIVRDTLQKGATRARELAEQTLDEVRRAMHMEYL